ncbi:MAG TPA: RNA polymerase sigma-70 factor [Bacteroidales bacterium]|nr:RNA polymerase sigma-70 factor [Bacteroidales bacterium]HPT11222.1 RNA polymerase sigma-70 factor [Bacteroidales bacterium]
MDELYLISRLKQKDKVVFDFIFNYYYSGLCVYAKQFTGSTDAAEDVVQDFFVSLWVKASDLSINESLRAYLFSSVKNRCLDYVKHSRVKVKYEQSIISESAEYEKDNFTLFVESELREAIDRCLDKLPPRCREVFSLSRYKGRTNQQIAEQLGLSKRTVELQISNALKILRVELKPFLPLFIILFRIK